MKKTITDVDGYLKVGSNNNARGGGDDCRSDATSARTERTSLGKSIRGEYKSYSEKFLAEQEDIKRRCLLAIMEGRPLSDVGVGGVLLLTDGRSSSTTTSVPKSSFPSSSSSMSSCPIDPDADIVVERKDCGSRGGSHSNVVVSYRGTTDDDFQASALGSARRGVYGGGVRYFTPDNSFYRSEGGTGSDMTELGESEVGGSDGGDIGEGYASMESEMEMEELMRECS